MNFEAGRMYQIRAKRPGYAVSEFRGWTSGEVLQFVTRLDPAALESRGLFVQGSLAPDRFLSPAELVGLPLVSEPPAPVSTKRYRTVVKDGSLPGMMYWYVVTHEFWLANKARLLPMGYRVIDTLMPKYAAVRLPESKLGARALKDEQLLKFLSGDRAIMDSRLGKKPSVQQEKFFTKTSSPFSEPPVPTPAQVAALNNSSLSKSIYDYLGARELKEKEASAFDGYATHTERKAGPALGRGDRERVRANKSTTFPKPGEMVLKHLPGGLRREVRVTTFPMRDDGDDEAYVMTSYNYRIRLATEGELWTRL